MDLESRTRWGRYLAEQTEEMQQSLSDDWNAFSEWTLSLIKEAGQMETYLTQQFDAARQREQQTPVQFHAYLDSLEKHLPRAAERARAHIFYAKLRTDLRQQIAITNTHLPETQQGMVDLATQYWNVLYRGVKRKSKAPTNTDFRKDISHKRPTYDRQHRNQSYSDPHLRLDPKDRTDSQRSRIDPQKN